VLQLLLLLLLLCAEAGQRMVTCLVVAGGVAANAKVRATLQAVAAKYNLPCLVPPVKFCSDNGLMVAWTGVERLKLGLCRYGCNSIFGLEI
jgi:tRNA A37 threonylcarbamoyltransferase TsaD